MSFLPVKSKDRLIYKKPRCKDDCRNEASINGSGYGRYNARCTYCQVAMNTDKTNCFCCGMKLRRRKSVNNNLKHKENLIKRYE